MTLSEFLKCVLSIAIFILKTMVHLLLGTIISGFAIVLIGITISIIGITISVVVSFVRTWSAIFALFYTAVTTPLHFTEPRDDALIRELIILYVFIYLTVFIRFILTFN